MHFCFVSLAAGAESFGLFVIVKGQVSIESVDGKESREAKVNSRIVPGETVITSADSRAKIVMSDRNVFNILPSTRLKIEKYSEGDGERNVKLNLIEGRVRSKVEQKYNTTSNKFEIRTVTAVAGVRGTDFVTGFDKRSQQTDVVTLRGSVSFLPIQGGVPMPERAVDVRAGQRSEARGTGNVSEPQRLSPKEIMIQDSQTRTTRVDISPESLEGLARSVVGGGKEILIPVTGAKDIFNLPFISNQPLPRTGDSILRLTITR